MQQQIDDLWDWSNAADSEARLREAADAAEPGRERDILLTQVARALGLQQRYAEALDILDGLSVDWDHELSVRTTLERGRILNSSGDPDAARPLFEEAAAAAQTAGLENLAVDAIHMVAIVAGPLEQGALNERAIAMAEAASDPRARQWLASLYNNLGWTRFDAGEVDEAQRLFELALAEREQRDDPRETGIARWAVARVLRARGQARKALAMQRKLARNNKAIGVEDPYVDEELGENLLALGREAEAAPYFARAAEGLARDPWLAEHEPQRIERLRQLGATPRRLP